MRNFSVHSDKTRKEMLESIGLSQIEDLFLRIPQEVRTSTLELDKPKSEMEVQRLVKSISYKNHPNYVNFQGGGVYNKFVPAVVGDVARRWEFLTSYTPYQPEISQGSLQIMYEFQTMICRLTGMDISNATVYDGATACAESCLMATRISKKDKVLVSQEVNPEYLEVIKTYLWAGNKDIEIFETLPENTEEYAAVLIQNPNYYGEILDIKPVGCLLIVCVDISSLSVLKPPSEYCADIVVGDIQTLGIPMNFGGPHAGFIACKEKFMRQMPGRLAGKTTDAEGKVAYTLTIQTREQHIKREKATSNICSNQALIGLCANVYLSALGETGFRQTGYLSAKNAHMLAKKLEGKGFKIINKNFYNEFVYEVEDSEKTLKLLKNNNILGGIKFDKTHILVTATEMNTEEEIDRYANVIK